MKRTIVLGFLLAVVLILSGCGGVEIYENVQMEVTEYSRVPADVIQDEKYDYRYAVLKVSGSPSDHFYGWDAIGLVEIIDEGAQNMCVPTPLEGMQDDILVKDTIHLKLLLKCPNKEAKESVFIFYQAPSKVVGEIAEEAGVYDLETVVSKKTMGISEKISEEGLTLIKNYVKEAKESQEKYEQEKVQQEKEQTEKEQKIKETQEKYDKSLQECLTSNEAMQACLNNEYNTAEINELKERYNSCISNIQNKKTENCGIEWSGIYELRKEACSENPEYGCLVPYLKPDHNGEQILEEEIEKIQEQQKDICKSYDIKEYCKNKVDKELCANNEYCSYISKEIKEEYETY